MIMEWKMHPGLPIKRKMVVMLSNLLMEIMGTLICSEFPEMLLTHAHVHS